MSSNSAEFVGALVDTIKEEEDPKRAVGYLAELVELSHKNLSDALSQINKILLGNGSPDEGLVVRVKTIERRITYILIAIGVIGIAVVMSMDFEKLKEVLIRIFELLL